jgi:hypothetical protein
MTSATNVYERDIPVASATVPVRLDDPATNPAPANRYWVRVVNPHATKKIFIGHSSSMMNVTNCEVIDPFNGVWEDSASPSIPIYALSEDGVSITVRIKQYV